MRLRPTLVVALVALVAMLGAAACSSSTGTATGDGAPAGADDDRPLVIATTSIWGDVAVNALGDAVDVEVLIPVGTDAHEFEPTPADLARVREADLVIANGLGLEEALLPELETAVAEGVEVFEVAPELGPIEFTEIGGHGDEEEHADEQGEDDHGAEDPHVWMDPDRMARAATLIAERAAEIDGVDSAAVNASAAAYGEELEAADARVQSALEVIPTEARKLVTNHESLGYFAERYTFELVGVVISGGGTDAEPSASELAELSEVIRAEGVPAIFAETSSSTDLAEALAAESGDVEVVELYTESLGEPGSGADSLIGMLETNATRIAQALG